MNASSFIINLVWFGFQFSESAVLFVIGLIFLLITGAGRYWARRAQDAKTNLDHSLITNK